MIRSAESFAQILPAVRVSAIINFVSLFRSSGAQQTGGPTTPFSLQKANKFAYWVRGYGAWSLESGLEWSGVKVRTIKSNLHAKEMAGLFPSIHQSWLPPLVRAPY